MKKFFRSGTGPVIAAPPSWASNPLPTVPTSSSLSVRKTAGVKHLGRRKDTPEITAYFAGRVTYPHHKSPPSRVGLHRTMAGQRMKIHIFVSST